MRAHTHTHTHTHTRALQHILRETDRQTQRQSSKSSGHVCFGRDPSVQHSHVSFSNTSHLVISPRQNQSTKMTFTAHSVKSPYYIHTHTDRFLNVGFREHQFRKSSSGLFALAVYFSFPAGIVLWATGASIPQRQQANRRK